MVEYDLGRVVGDKGDTGNGITSIQKTSSSGKVDTYTITYSDGSTSTFTVTNGSDASVTVDSALSSISVNPVQNKVINSALNDKVSNNDNRLSDNRNPLSNNLAPTSENLVDLDNVRGTGFYYALGNSNIQYVSNLPSGWGNISFYLTVEETISSNYCKQTITSYNGEKMFVRTRWGTGWNAWKSYLSSDSVVDNLNSTSSTNVLSARQGKVLADLIGDAITYINGTGGN